MADDEFNLDDPGSEGGSEASLDDFFQPTGGKETASGSGGDIDDFFAPPEDEPKAKPAKISQSDLPIDKSRMNEFPDEPAPEPLTPDEAPLPMGEEPGESIVEKGKSFFARSWIYFVLLLVLILAGGSAFMVYVKFFGAKPEVAAVAAPPPKAKPPKKPKPPKPAPAAATGVATDANPSTPATGATIEKPAAPDATIKPAGGTGVETEDEPPAAPVATPPKPGKPGKPAPAIVPSPEAPVAPVTAPVAPPKPGKPGKPVKPAAEPPKPAPVATAKPAPPKPAPAPPKPTPRPVVAAATGGPYYIQVGSYMLESSKTQPEQKLAELGYNQYHYVPESRRLRIHHVLVGKNLSPDQARQVTSQLQDMGYAAEPGPDGSVKAYSYGDISIARATRAKLIKAGMKNVTIKSETKTVTLDQLRVGGYASKGQATKAQSELRRKGFRGALVIKE